VSRKSSVRRRGPKPAVKLPDFHETPRPRSAIFVSRLLADIRSHSRISWAALLFYAAAVTFPHEKVQAACSMLAERITHAGVYRISAGIALVEVAALTWFLLRSMEHLPQRRRVITRWILTLILIAATWRVLTANNLELVHYPQYFPEGVALAALTLSPVETLAWITVLGGLDEAYQYFVLSRGLPTVFDFNDIYMDLLGGAAGVVFAMAFLRCKRTRGIVIHRRAGVIALLSAMAVGLLLWATGKMVLVEDKANPHYWFALGRFRAPTFWVQIVTNGPYKYHTLTPLEGAALILGTIALYAILVRKYVISCAT
jgi:hypothetical protein